MKTNAKPQAMKKSQVHPSPTQQAIIDARDKNILVSASAGSGKTSVLVNRLCSLVIDDKIGIDRILAMTFTEDAASEMKSRLKKKLQEQNLKDPYILKQLALLETASISTIHQFCLGLLQKYYYLIPIPYSMSRNVETGMKNSQALADAYLQAAQNLGTKRYADLKLYLESFSKTEEDLQTIILKFLEIAHTKPDPVVWMDSCRTQSEDTIIWFYDAFLLRIKALIEIMDTMLKAIPEINFPKIEKQAEWIRIFEVKKEYLKAAEKELENHNYPEFQKAFFQYMENTGKFTPKINKERFDEIQKDSRELEKEIGDMLYDQEMFDTRSQEMKPFIDAFIDLAKETQLLFQKEKRNMAIIDYSDMEQFAWQLLNIPAVADEVKNRYEVIMVDEYQDTNDLQEAIISKACRENNVFRVGDVKQSIYGFRQAKPSLMRSLMDQQDTLHETMYMDENFRSCAGLISFNNAFFQILMNTPGMESQFGIADAARPGLESQKEGKAQPVRFLYTVYGGWTEPGAPKTNDVLARKVHKANRIDLIAQDIQQKIKEGYSYRDIAILTRASTNHATIKEGLEAYQIPLISRARRGFYTNSAVQIVMATLKSLVNPRDDISFMAMLCSPIGRQTQADVVQIASRREPGTSLYDSIRLQKDMIEFYRILSSWRELPVGEIVEKIYNFHDFYYGHTTAKDKTNLDLFLEKASRVEQDMSLEDFTELIMQEEKFNDTAEAMPFGREADVVKITTIHSSKGLQYPIVYLLTDDRNQDLDSASPIYLDPDLGISMKYLSPNRHIKAHTREHIALEHRRFMEDQNEKMRLLYVACTRAEKELIFVDTLKNLDDFNYPMGMRAIWENKGFTGWAAHIFQNYSNPLFKMEEKGVLERPDSESRKNYKYKKPSYKLPVQEISSLTASAAKLPKKWRAVNLHSASGMERGSLFHLMAEQLTYPYQREQAVALAARQGMKLNDRDYQQFLSLNNCETYAEWLTLSHKFEAPYNVFIDGAFLHGYMDLLVEDGNDIHILDFKTDSVISMDRLEKVYRPQLEAYKRAVSYIHPDKNIRIWLYSFYLEELHEIRE